MPSARPLQETFTKGEGGHRDDHGDLAYYANRAMLVGENFGGDSAPDDLVEARTNLGLGSGAEGDLSDATPAATAAAGSAGTSDDVSRADHVHPGVPTSRTVSAGNGLTGGGSLAADRTLAVDYGASAAATSTSGSAGVATTVSRSDHVHASPQLSSTNPVALGSASAGAATASSRQDHVHPTTGLLLTSALSSATPSALASTGAAGSSSSVARDDHSHGVNTVWTTYTPTFTNVTIGNGTSTGRYTLIHPKLMAFVIQIGIGSTTSVTGAISVGLPGGVTGATTVPQRVVATAYDSSADTQYSGAANVNASDLSSLRFHGIAGTGNATTPFTWATNDNMRFWGLIELA